MIAQLMKDPAETRDLTVDWSTFLTKAGDTIASVEWATAGLTGGTESNTATTAKIRLSGGTVNTTQEVSCTITTAAGQVVQRTVEVRVRDL